MYDEMNIGWIWVGLIIANFDVLLNRRLHQATKQQFLYTESHSKHDEILVKMGAISISIVISPNIFSIWYKDSGYEWVVDNSQHKWFANLDGI